MPRKTPATTPPFETGAKTGARSVHDLLLAVARSAAVACHRDAAAVDMSPYFHAATEIWQQPAATGGWWRWYILEGHDLVIQESPGALVDDVVPPDTEIAVLRLALDRGTGLPLVRKTLRNAGASKVIERSVEAAVEAADAYHRRHGTTPPDILAAEPDEAPKATPAAAPKRRGRKARKDEMA